MSRQPRPQRGSNFSKTEEDKLIRLALEKKHILENKKTDAITSKKKDAAWQVLADLFNATSEGQFRTEKALRDKYNNIKRYLRKSKTGGGPSHQKEDSTLLNQLSDAMGVSFDGLVGDDEEIFEEVKIEDAVEFDENYLSDEDAEFLLEEDKPTNEQPPLNEQVYNPGMLRTKRRQSINTSKTKNKKKQKVEDADISDLKKQILQQRLKHDQEEHDQKLMHADQLHRIRVKILLEELEANANKRF